LHTGVDRRYRGISGHGHGAHKQHKEEWRPTAKTEGEIDEGFLLALNVHRTQVGDELLVLQRNNVSNVGTLCSFTSSDRLRSLRATNANGETLQLKVGAVEVLWRFITRRRGVASSESRRITAASTHYRLGNAYSGRVCDACLLLRSDVDFSHPDEVWLDLPLWGDARQQKFLLKRPRTDVSASVLQSSTSSSRFLYDRPSSSRSQGGLESLARVSS